MLSLAAGSLERLHELKQRALGLDRDSAIGEEMPQLIVCDLTTDDVADMRAAQEESEDVP
jgi:hypothetical protein